MPRKRRLPRKFCNRCGTRCFVHSTRYLYNVRNGRIDRIEVKYICPKRRFWERLTFIRTIRYRENNHDNTTLIFSLRETLADWQGQVY